MTKQGPEQQPQGRKSRPLGSCKVKIKDSESTYFLTYDDRALGAQKDESDHEYWIKFDGKNETMTIEINENPRSQRWVGLTDLPEFAPVTSKQTWKCTGKPGKMKLSMKKTTNGETRTYYWSIQSKDGVNYIRPVTESDKAWFIVLV